MKRLLILIGVLSIILTNARLFGCAETYDTNIGYIIYDENGVEVDSGTIIKSNSRATFTGITLKDGQTAEFAPDNSVGFLAAPNRVIKFKYSMNKTGYMTTQLYRYRSVREAKNQSTHKGVTLQFTTTVKGNYYALVRNDSGSDKNIYGITFDILNP